jgi:hypothetical protein
MNTLEVICKLLRDKEVSGRQFAITLGFETDAVHRWKTGRSASYVDHIDIIAGYFNMSVEQLMELSDDPRDIVRKFVFRRGLIQYENDEERQALEKRLVEMREKKAMEK